MTEKKSARRTVIGVMGGGQADQATIAQARELGALIARAGHVLLTGGRPAGVMEAASRGAFEAGGLVIGILQSTSVSEANAFVHLAIASGMGDARNLINVLSSDVIVACPGGAGTLSEVALAIKNSKPVVLLGFDPGLPFEQATREGRLHRASDAPQAMEYVARALGQP